MIHMIMNDTSKTRMNTEGKDEILRKSKLRLFRRKRKRAEESTLEEERLQNVPHVHVDPSKTPVKSLIPIPNFTPLDLEETLVHLSEEKSGENHLKKPLILLHDQTNHSHTAAVDTESDVTRPKDRRELEEAEHQLTQITFQSLSTKLLHKKDPVENTVTIHKSHGRFHSSDPMSSVVQLHDHNISSSSHFKRESQRKRFVKQEKQLELIHDDLIYISKHSTTTSTTTHPMRNNKIESHTPCTLCSTCTCSLRGSALAALEQNARKETQSKHHIVLARNDAEIEAALIARLARLEKSASWLDSLCTKVSRELKRHRKHVMNQKMQKMQLQKGNLSKGHVFLQDADDCDILQDMPILPKRMVGRATQKTFSFRKKHQPTLTQMMGDHDESQSTPHEDSDDDHDDDNNDHAISQNKYPIKESKKNDDDMEDHQKGINDENIPNVDHVQNSNFDIEPIPMEEVFTQLSPIEKGDSHQVKLRMASCRGKARDLWAASKLSSQDLKRYLQHEVEISDMQQLLQLDLNANDDDGLEELLDIFQDNYVVDDTTTHEKGHGFWKDSPATSSLGEKKQVNMSQLSPIAKAIHERMVHEVEADHGKLTVLNELCPSWKENQRFALCQSKEELHKASENLHTKQLRILKAIGLLKKQRVALQVFEYTIKMAIDRHTTGILSSPLKEHK